MKLYVLKIELSGGEYVCGVTAQSEEQAREVFSQNNKFHDVDVYLCASYELVSGEPGYTMYGGYSE